MSTQHEQVACILLGHGTRQAEEGETGCEQCEVTCCASCASAFVYSGLCQLCQDERFQYDAERDEAYRDYLAEAAEREHEKLREQLEEKDHLKFWRRGF